MRKAGILMPLASLPSETGIGEMGNEAYQFIDIMKEMGAGIWQILPLNPLGYGNSPYQPYSSFAGDPIYISLQVLKEEGLISSQLPTGKTNTPIIDYEGVKLLKEPFLKEAFGNFKPNDDYKLFCSQDWVFKYGVFITFKKANNLVCWNEWPDEFKNWITDGKLDLTPYQSQIDYEMFLQYTFYKQWMALKTYANLSNIKIMGDIPIYVGIDSLDVWSNQSCFLLDADGKPTFIAGVPPDYFAATGQRWGNPIYNWEYIEETKFDFWINRLRYNNTLFDIIRIDHFRAFDTYWKIPAACQTAIDGEWVTAPGYKLFDCINDRLKGIEIVVEDLGDLREEVLTLRDHYKLDGMKIVQFTFDPNETNNDFDDRENMLIYTGTHDNQTIKGWFLSQPKRLQKQITTLMAKNGYRQKKIAHKFIAFAMDSVASTAIVPVQDIIDLKDAGRINVPGTLGSPNWEWRLTDFKALGKNSNFMSVVIDKSKRR